MRGSQKVAFTVALVLGLGVQANEPIWDANEVDLESQKLADGVFAVIPTDAEAKAPEGLPIATTGGFIVGEEAVLVVESMLNERLNSQLFDLIETETNKPIRYLVNTSFHGDHSYGNYYVPDDVTIIQHEYSSTYVREHFEADRAFMIQNFGENRGIENVEPSTGDVLVGRQAEVTVDLGGKVVKIKDFGFAQTGGDLFVWVPQDNVLWTGNAVIAQKPALPWLLDGHLLETLNTLQQVRSAFNAQTIIVPGHGPVTDVSAIDWSIDYLTAVRDGVQSSIDAGLSLEETVEANPLLEFKGYALFGWVHPSLNIPAAFQDLSENAQ